MRKAQIWIATVAALAATGLVGENVEAHFTLQSPPAISAQDDLGSPQKTAPCGPNGAGEPTGAVTTYQAGSTITITIDEKIHHPGHYRVALAVDDVNELPDAPPVTPSANDECASTVIQDPPVFPVLADGMLEHSAAFGSPQSFEVTLPDDVTCDNCTLQVIEYMSSHGAPCFYYHCANIAIQEEPVMATAAATTTSTGTGTGGSGGASTSSGAGGDGGDPVPFNPAFGANDEGCSCSAIGTKSDLGAFALLALGGLVFATRRRRG